VIEILERVKGIEPSSSAWKALVLLAVSNDFPTKYLFLRHCSTNDIFARRNGASTSENLFDLLSDANVTEECPVRSTD